MVNNMKEKETGGDDEEMEEVEEQDEKVKEV